MVEHTTCFLQLHHDDSEHLGSLNKEAEIAEDEACTIRKQQSDVQAGYDTRGVAEKFVGGLKPVQCNLELVEIVLLLKINYVFI